MAHPTYDKVKGWLESESIRGMLEASLGSAADLDGWINAALASIGTDKDVLGATPESILGAFIEAASLGLRFEGPLGEAYIATRSVKDGKDNRGKWKYRDEAQLQVGYRGLMKLARRDPRVRKVEAIIVHANDVFDHRLGSDQFLHHTWDVRKPRGEMVAVYAAVRYHDGFYDFGQPYSIDSVMRHRERILADKRIRVVVETDGRERFFKVWDDGEKEMDAYSVRRIPWITYIEAMIQKTAVRWSAKFWDLTPDFDRAAALISIDESGRSQKLEELARGLVAAVDSAQAEGGGATGRTQQRPADGPQLSSLARMGNLKAQMLRESGAGQGANEGPPPEGDGAGAPISEPVEEDAPPPQLPEMTEEEKEEQLRAELESAKEFEEEQDQALRDAADIVVGPEERRGGRRGKGA